MNKRILYVSSNRRPWFESQDSAVHFREAPYSIDAIGFNLEKLGWTVGWCGWKSSSNPFILARKIDEFKPEVVYTYGSTVALHPLICRRFICKHQRFKVVHGWDDHYGRIWGDMFGCPGKVFMEWMDSASQISSGTLSPARGGTGTTSLANLRTLLALEGSAGIVAGSYTGKGTYGSGNKNSLTFSSPPKLLIVMPVSNTSHADYGGFVVLNGVQALRAGGLSDDVSNSESQLQFTWGNTVTWYNTSNSYFQQNASGWTYNYFAIL